jgi:hypothetical protein
VPPSGIEGPSYRLAALLLWRCVSKSIVEAVGATRVVAPTAVSRLNLESRTTGGKSAIYAVEEAALC